MLGKLETCPTVRPPAVSAPACQTSEVSQTSEVCALVDADLSQVYSRPGASDNVFKRPALPGNLMLLEASVIGHHTIS